MITMSMKFHVPTLRDQQAAQSLRELILTSEPDADIDINLQTNVVTIDAKASQETFEELITAAGHSVDER